MEICKRNHPEGLLSSNHPETLTTHSMDLIIAQHFCHCEVVVPDIETVDKNLGISLKMTINQKFVFREEADKNRRKEIFS